MSDYNNMGRRMGENNKRSPRSSKYQVIIKEATNVNEERTFRVEHAGSLDGNDGELPLFFPTTSKSSPRLGNTAGDLNTEDVNLKHVEARWPLGSQEIAAWASSFRFELDSEDGERLQEMLERDAQIAVDETNRGRKLADNRSLTEGTPAGGSFRFISGNQSGYLKPPRQLEKIHGSNRFTAVANACANEKQRCEASKPSDGLSVVQVAAGRMNVAMNDHVSASSGRSEILRRLSDLKAHPLSPRFAPKDAVNYHGDKAKMAAARDELHGRLKSSLPLVKNEYSGKGSSSPASQYQRKPQKNALSELEMGPNIGERRRQSNSSSGLRGSPSIPAPLASQEHPITPTSRFRNGERQLVAGSSIQGQIVSIRKQPHAVASNVISSPSPDHTPSVPAAIPFKWEEKPGKPKTIAAAAHRALARRLSKEGMEVSNCIEMKLGSQKDDFKPSTGEVESGNSRKGTEASARSLSDTGNTGDPVGRSGSHRYYGRAHLSRHSRDASLGRSSRRYSTQEKEAHIDLDASAAAKFLVEAFESPSRSPGLQGSSPTNFAVPFKWEDTPGKAKVETIARSPNLLQLPPRLVVPSYRSSESLSRELRASHPFSGFFAPCMTAPSPAHSKQSDRALVQYTSSESLPPKVPSTPARRKRHGFVGRCSSTPREGCQIRVSKSFDDKASSHSSSEKASFDHLSTTSSTVFKPRNLFISELKNSSNAPSSPTSILCGPEESSSQTSTSNVMFSSGDLEDFTRQTNHSRQSASKSSSSASYESIDEDFADLPSPSYSVPAPPPSDPQRFGESQGTPNQALGSIAAESSGNEHYALRSKVNSPLKLPKTGKSSAKLKSQDQLETIHTLESLSPLSNYFQCLERTAAATSTSASTEDVSLLDKQGAPTSSGYLNTEGKPLALETLPTLQSVAKQETNPSPQASPKRPTRLPYTMPSAAEQFLASCSTSGRRQLIQDLSPRLLHQYSGRRLPASHSGSNTPRVDRYLTSAPQASHAEQMSPSPAYAASLELFSPAANIMAQRRKWPATSRTPLAKAPPPKPRRRSRFMLSICKSLKRVLCRQRRRKPIEPTPWLMYHDGKSPAPTYRFKTTYT